MATATKRDKAVVDIPIWYRKLDKAMRARGFNAHRMSQRLGVAPSRFTLWKRGQGTATTTQLFEMCDILSVSIHWLMDDKAAIDADPAGEPAPDPELSAARRAVLTAIEGLDDAEAIRRLVAALVAPGPPRARRAIRKADLTPPDGGGDQGGWSGE